MGRLKSMPSRLGAAAPKLKPAPKTAESFYQSPEWLTLMADLKRIRGNWCEDCGAGKCRIYGDHIVERKDGGAALDPANIRLRCGPCHNRKTAVERAKRATEPIR